MTGRRIGILAVIVALSVGLLGGGVLATRTPERTGGTPPVLDTPQRARADDQGIVLSVPAARFSATATYMRIDADISGWEEATGGKAVRGAIPADGMVAGLAPAEAWVALTIGSGAESLARFAPIENGVAPVIVVREVELLTVGGEISRVSGTWHLDLTPPANLAEALRSERLAGSVAITTNGITIRPTGGRRSTTETLVTVELQSSHVRPFGQPRLITGDDSARGILTAEEDGGRLLTYAFPPSQFGLPARIEFDTFRTKASDGVSETSFDLQLAMARSAVKGEDREVVTLTEGDLIALQGGAPAPITRVTFFDVQGGRAIEIELSANYDSRATTYALTTATGRIATLLSGNDLYRTDPTGTIRGGTHQLVFAIGEADVAGVLTLLIGSEPTTLIRGLWSAELGVDRSVD